MLSVRSSARDSPEPGSFILEIGCTGICGGLCQVLRWAVSALQTDPGLTHVLGPRVDVKGQGRSVVGEGAGASGRKK